MDNDILFHWSFETIELIHNSMPIHLLIKSCYFGCQVGYMGKLLMYRVDCPFDYVVIVCRSAKFIVTDIYALKNHLLDAS